MSFTPRKRFGQHFLNDREVIGRIVDHVDPAPDASVLEIGPGLGALTRPLLAKLSRLYVVEIDRDLAANLEREIPDRERLIIFREDALRFDYCGQVPGRLLIVGNLPYNISTPLLFALMKHLSCIDRMVLMLQKEVGDRICAGPGSRDYGRLSVMIQAACTPRRLFDVDASCFTPPPKVTSTVLELAPGSGLVTTIDDHALFARLVRTAFSRRRKTIRNALKPLAPENLLNAAGIDPTSRPEQVSVEAYAGLANALAGILRETHPDHQP